MDAKEQEMDIKKHEMAVVQAAACSNHHTTVISIMNVDASVVIVDVQERNS